LRAAPLETLQAAALITASSEKEKRDLESVSLGIATAQMVVCREPVSYARPTVIDFTHRHIVSLTVRGNLWHAVFDWRLAAVLWFLYFARLRWRTATLVGAIFFTLIPIPFVLHSVLAGGRVLEFAIVWILGSTDLGGVFPAARWLELLPTLAWPASPSRLVRRVAHPIFFREVEIFDLPHPLSRGADPIFPFRSRNPPESRAPINSCLGAGGSPVCKVVQKSASRKMPYYGALLAPRSPRSVPPASCGFIMVQTLRERKDYYTIGKAKLGSYGR